MSNPAPLSDLSLHPIAFGGVSLSLDGRRALWWGEEKTLIVSDLHLGKGQSFAKFGALLPPYDTNDTLLRLLDLIAAYRPNRLVCLGDSFHRRDSLEQLPQAERALLDRATREIGHWLWIVGNHDPDAPAGVAGEVMSEWVHRGIRFRHALAPTVQSALEGLVEPVPLQERSDRKPLIPTTEQGPSSRATPTLSLPRRRGREVSVSERVGAETDPTSRIDCSIPILAPATHGVSRSAESHRSPQREREPTIIGHFHPKARFESHGKRWNYPCFAWNDNLLVMPSFGSFTGGLDVRDQALTGLLGKEMRLACATRSGTILRAEKNVFG